MLRSSMSLQRSCRRAASAAIPDDIWELGHDLGRIRREFDAKYDYRYSQLEFVFGRLLREKRIAEDDLAGLHEDKLEIIRRIASL
jgi:hypothetical protein